MLNLYPLNPERRALSFRESVSHKMYDYFKGTLASLKPDAAVIDCGGIGYKLTVSASTHAKLSPLLGREATLFAHLAVREDAMELYGFFDETERSLFIHLLSVSGVGPKAAVSVLSTLSADKLAFCVASGDAKAIASSPGVGLKTAQKIILELKDKLAKEFSVRRAAARRTPRRRSERRLRCGQRAAGARIFTRTGTRRAQGPRPGAASGNPHPGSAQKALLNFALLKK